MGTTTFSGPVKAGTISNTTGTTLGKDVAVLSIGDTVGGNATFINAYSITVASGAGRKYPTTQAGGALAWADTGIADKKLTWTTTGATDAGEIRATVLYQQNINLA